MATYAIGDIQGCFDSFLELLRAIDFEAATDRLWLAGDLVNRGPKNVEVLRWCVEHASVIKVVLGNHDLHVLAASAGLRTARGRDTMQDVLHAPDRATLTDYLWQQPFLQEDEAFVMVHAGCPPRWTLEELRTRAQRLRSRLDGDSRVDELEALLDPADGSSASSDLAALTRMRTVDEAGAPVYGFAGAPLDCPPSETPWFDYPGRRTLPKTVLCGHWAALGLMLRPDVIALDSGCVWGARLSAVRLEDRKVFQVPGHR